MEGSSKELEHFLFHAGQVLFLSHEAINGFCQRLHQFEVTQLIMRHKMQDPGIALEVVAHVYLVIDDALQVIYTGAIVAVAEIKRGYLIVQYEDAMSIDKEIIFCQLL